MFKFVIVLCAVLLASGANASGSSSVQEERTTDATQGIVSDTVLATEETDRSSAAMETEAIPEDCIWKLPVENYKSSAEGLINETIKTFVRYINNGQKVNNPVLEEVMQQLNAFNAWLDNSTNILIQKIKSSAENRTNYTLHDVDVDECEGYSDLMEPVKTAWLKGASCIDDVRNLMLEAMDEIKSIIFNGLKGLNVIRNSVQNCGEDVHDVSSAVKAMRCYHDHKIVVSRSFKKTIRRLRVKVRKFLALLASSDNNLVVCRNESGFKLLFEETEKKVNDINECVIYYSVVRKSGLGRLQRVRKPQ